MDVGTKHSKLPNKMSTASHPDTDTEYREMEIFNCTTIGGGGVGGEPEHWSSVLAHCKAD